MNKVVLVGNLTHDPEFSQTSGGVSLCRFSIAVNRAFINANGEREADFLNIVTWRGLADTCAKYLHKGSKVSVSGSLQTSSYESKNGEKRYRTDVVADEVEFLSSPKNEAAEPNQAAQKKAKEELVPSKDDGLPF